jgi:hypothetical protein
MAARTSKARRAVLTGLVPATRTPTEALNLQLRGRPRSNGADTRAMKSVRRVTQLGDTSPLWRCHRSGSEDAPSTATLPTRIDLRIRDGSRIPVIEAAVEHQPLRHPRVETMVVEAAVRVPIQLARVVVPAVAASRSKLT